MYSDENRRRMLVTPASLHAGSAVSRASSGTEGSSLGLLMWILLMAHSEIRVSDNMNLH
jgi:hypothetical protein